MAQRYEHGAKFRERLFKALHRWQTIHGMELQKKELGEMVSRGLQRPKPFHPSQVGRWLKGQMPDLRTICELAKALEVDPGWLAFGDDSLAPAPTLIMTAPNGAYTPIERTKNGLAGDLVEGRQGVEG